MERPDQWRTLKQYAVEEAAFEVGDLVYRKDQTKSEKTFHSKIGIILSVDKTVQVWIKMAKVMWSGTADIEEVATLYLERVPQDDTTS